MLKRTILRTIKKTMGRYVAILAIIALGVGFLIGLRVTEDAMRKTADKYLGDLQLYDYRLISTLGLVEEDVEAFQKLEGIETAVGSVSADVIVKKNDGADAVLHAHTLLDGLNGLDVREGRLPQKADECVLDAHNFPNYKPGSTIRLSDINSEETFDSFAYDEYTVVGLVDSPEYMNFNRGTTALTGGKVTGYIYLLPDGFTTDYHTEIYLKLSGTHEIYSDEYETALDTVRTSVETLLEERAEIRFRGIYEEAEAEIDDAAETLKEKKAELADAQKEVDEGWNTYRTKRDEALKTLEDSKKKLDDARTKLDEAKKSLKEAKESPYAALPEIQENLRMQEAVLQQSEADYEKNKAAYEQAVTDAEKEFCEAEQELQDALKKIDDAKPEMAEAEEEIQEAREKLEELEKPTVYALDRSSNFGYMSFQNDISIVSGVAKVFPIFFFLVAALVCITTMTRMVSEQRTQNGVLKALGYSNFAVASQYLFYAGSASVLGCFIGFFLGSRFMPLALWEVYQIMYTIARPVTFVLDWVQFAVCTMLYLVCVLGVTYLVCHKDLKESAAGLMRPEAPSAGKRIFLEYMGFLWKRMKFLHKVSARNILRYKKRMFMMIIGIGGCMALLLTGFGIRDSIQPILEYQYGEISCYDATVSFRNELTEGGIEQFKDSVKGFASDSVFVHTESMDAIMEAAEKSVDIVAYDEDMSEFIKLHRGKTDIAWPGSGEAVINYGVAQKLNLKVGDELRLRDKEYKEMTVTVTGIYDNYIGDIVYLSEETYLEGFGIQPSANTAYLVFADDMDAHNAGAEILNIENVASLSLVADMKTRVGDMLSSLDYIVLIVLVCAGALAFIVLYNLTNITITERTREIATLKVLGFHRGEQNAYVFRENIILTIISAICGIPFGIALLQYTMSQIKIDGMYFGCRLNITSCILSLVITLFFTVAVDLAMTSKTRRINMAEAMKAIE